MRQEPIILLAMYAGAGLDATRRFPEYQIELVIMLAVGGLIALCFSIRKSRRNKADTVDTAIWAMIATLGSTALAYLMGAMLHGQTMPGTDLVMTAPFIAFITCISATPFIEWALAGGVWKIALEKLLAFFKAGFGALWGEPKP